jgi:hypothetical protein
MRLLLAVALFALGCQDNQAAREEIPVERIQVDPVAALRFKLRLGNDPAATIGAKRQNAAPRALHSRGGAE